MIQRLDYSANVLQALHRRAPGVSAMRFGAEVETGWLDGGHQEGFLSALSDRGLEELVVSKYDRSIESNLASEIVTLPLALPALSDVLRHIGEVLTAQERIVSLKGCGVHIHVSRGPLNEHVRRRLFSSIMFDDDALRRWNVSQERRPSAAQRREVSRLNDFWDMFSLRRPSNYCQRRSFGLVDMVHHSSHNSAVNNAQRTPTMEFRLFNATRNPEILVSYAEMVHALVEFCKGYKASNGAAPPPPVDYEAIWPLFMYHLVPRHFGSDNGRRGLGMAFDAMDNQQREEFLRREYPNPDDLITAVRDIDRHGMVDSLRQHVIESQMRMQATNLTYSAYARRLDGMGVDRSWLNESTYVAIRSGDRNQAIEPPWGSGLFPLDDFLVFALDNAKSYPSVVRRLGFKKFERFFAGHPEPQEREIDPAEPHEHLGVGCHVAWQCDPTYPVSKITWLDRSSTEGERMAEITALDCPSVMSSPVSDLLHLCPGAPSLEAHGEVF